MTRTPFALLALLLFGCQGPTTDPAADPGNDIDDGNPDDTPTYTTEVGSAINFASWNDDMTEVVDNSQSVEGIDFAIEGTELTGTTIGSVDLTPDVYTATFSGNLNGVTYLGSVTTDVTSGSLISGNLCVDLTGDWTCQNEYEGEQYEPYDVHIDVQSNCSVEADMDDEVEVNGHHWISENLDGVVSTNSLEVKMNHFGDNGAWYGVDTCIKQ